MKKLLFLLIVLLSTITVESQRFINDYDTSAPEDGDKLVGTDVSTSTVRNFTVGSVATKIKAEVVDESPGTTVTTKTLSKIAITPIEDAINALPLFSVTYDELIIFECSITDLIGTEIYILKLPKDSYGVGGTQLTATDVQLLNAIPYINDTEVFLSSNIAGVGSGGDNLQTALANLGLSIADLDETGVELSKDYGYYSDYPTNLNFVSWMGTAGESVGDALEKIAGENGNPAAAYFIYTGDVNQTITGHKTFNDLSSNIYSHTDISTDFSFIGNGNGALNGTDLGVIIHSSPLPGMRVTWTDGALIGSSSIKPYDAIAGHNSLYFGEMTGGGAFADTMILDAGNTVGGDGITVDWTQFDPEFTISIDSTEVRALTDPSDWSVEQGYRFRLINSTTIEVQITQDYSTGIAFTLGASETPSVTCILPAPCLDISANASVTIQNTGDVTFLVEGAADDVPAGFSFTYSIN